MIIVNKYKIKLYTSSNTPQGIIAPIRVKTENLWGTFLPSKNFCSGKKASKNFGSGPGV